MPRQSSGGTRSVKNSGENSVSPKKFTLLDLAELWFNSPFDGHPVNVEDCTDGEFKMFIQQYVELEGKNLDSWGLEDRRDVLNFMRKNSVVPNFLPNFSRPSDGLQPGLNENEKREFKVGDKVRITAHFSDAPLVGIPANDQRQKDMIELLKSEIVGEVLEVGYADGRIRVKTNVKYPVSVAPEQGEDDILVGSFEPDELEFVE